MSLPWLAFPALASFVFWGCQQQSGGGIGNQWQDLLKHSLLMKLLSQSFMCTTLGDMMNRPYWFWNWCGFVWDIWCQTKQLLITRKNYFCAGVNRTFNLFIIFVCLSPKRNIFHFCCRTFDTFNAFVAAVVFTAFIICTPWSLHRHCIRVSLYIVLNRWLDSHCLVIDCYSDKIVFYVSCKLGSNLGCFKYWTSMALDLWGTWQWLLIVLLILRILLLPVSQWCGPYGLTLIHSMLLALTVLKWSCLSCLWMIFLLFQFILCTSFQKISSVWELNIPFLFHFYGVILVVRSFNAFFTVSFIFWRYAEYKVLWCLCGPQIVNKKKQW